MNKQVEELVEWVAKEIHEIVADSGGELHLWELCKQPHYIEYAKQTLSHPDLALIDRRSPYYKQVTEGYGCVIPPAQELKEE